MKVKVEVTVEVDRDAWARYYEIRPEDVREDFREAAENAVRFIAGEVE